MTNVSYQIDRRGLFRLSAALGVGFGASVLAACDSKKPSSQLDVAVSAGPPGSPTETAVATQATRTEQTQAEFGTFIRSVDTMKLSRDGARNPSTLFEADDIARIAAGANCSHLAIATPYDDEFVPVLTKWVDAARKHNLKVWFRGNFAGWEGWFDKPKMTDPKAHHALTADFIKRHGALFADDDIFTPNPEANENGPLKDPRTSPQAKEAFGEFLVESYRTTTRAFEANVTRRVRPGYFSVNGDVAKILGKDVVSQTGNVIVIDHEVATPEQYRRDIRELSDMYRVPVVIGELGAPIEGIHMKQGERMSDAQQAQTIDGYMKVIFDERQRIGGVNYWVLINGDLDFKKPSAELNTTALLNRDHSKRPALDTLAAHYARLKS